MAASPFFLFLFSFFLYLRWIWPRVKIHYKKKHLLECTEVTTHLSYATDSQASSDHTSTSSTTLLTIIFLIRTYIRRQFCRCASVLCSKNGLVPFGFNLTFPITAVELIGEFIGPHWQSIRNLSD